VVGSESCDRGVPSLDRMRNVEGLRDRCAPHGLAVGPDGRCVLCRQESVAPAQEPPVDATALRNPFVWTALAAGLLCFAVVAKVAYVRVLVKGDQASAPAASAVGAATLTAAEPDPTTPPAAEPAHRAPISVSTPAILKPEIAPDTQAPPDRPLGTPTATISADPAERQGRQKQGPTEEELRSALRRVSITMYSTDWCPSCKNARAWFRANNISVDDRNVDNSESARRAQLLLNPKGSIPTIDVDGEVMVGFGGAAMEDMLRRAARRRAQKF
jgi:glutaredoxin